MQRMTKTIHPFILQHCLGKKKLVLALINEFHCDPNTRGYKDQSLLHSACIRGHANIVRIVPKSISPFVVDLNGDTPLHTCAAASHIECVKLLLSNRAPLWWGKNSSRCGNRWSQNFAVWPHDWKKDEIYIDYDLVQEIAKEKYSCAQRITRIFVIGNPGAGKSSLVETLKREERLDIFRPVSESSVPRHTAGIIPSIHMRRHYGRVLFYDFAGNPEYYSPMQPSLRILLLLDKEPIVPRLKTWSIIFLSKIKICDRL